MGNHAVQAEWGQWGGVCPHERRVHRLSGNANHHSAPLNAVGASSGGGTLLASVAKQNVSIALGKTKKYAWLLID